MAITTMKVVQDCAVAAFEAVYEADARYEHAVAEYREGDRPDVTILCYAEAARHLRIAARRCDDMAQALRQFAAKEEVALGPNL